MKDTFNNLFSKSVVENGFNQPEDKLVRRYATERVISRLAMLMC